MMRWNRPKAVISKLLFISAVLLLILSIIWLVAAYIWIHKPNEIQKLDKYLPNIYQEKITKVYKKVTKANTKEKKYKAYLNLLDNFPNMTSLHKGYRYIGESYTYVINYLQNNNKLKQALYKA
ncbi:MAG TPA: hypothetical protein ENJ44_03975, partial [Oceanospirillales bacterium]|nr:hypothetical protein [Oceanospirillales bacterium]